MKTALVSVFEKRGIIELGKGLIESGYRIISTGGTISTLTQNEIAAIPVSKITGFPEILNGRVKTLHPKIHAGLLYLRDNENHNREMKKFGLNGIDLLVVNLYPFEYTLKKLYGDIPQTSDDTEKWSELIETIDVGGPAMLRAAAKNYKYVTVITEPDDYDLVLKEIKEKGDTTIQTRRFLAAKAFLHVSKYDDLVNRVLSLATKSLSLNVPMKQSMRYGENPHQNAAFYQNENDWITQLHGKELSYNNLLDIDAALKTIIKFSEPTVAILKHTNPCGIASDSDISIAFKKAYATDHVSSFGGIVIANQTVDINFVNELNVVFTEIIIAPDFEQDALEKLQKKKDRRIISYKPQSISENRKEQLQSCLNGYLIQTPDMFEDENEMWEIPTKRQPDEDEMEELKFAWQVVKMLKSNAVCLTKNKQTIGLGIGQTARIFSINIAIMNALNMKFDLSNSVAASDGFFPFRDSIIKLHKHGIKCVIQPGGAKGDEDIIKACDEFNIAMVMTKRRHFRH